MKFIPIPLQIAILAVAMTGFYTMVGQAVPQKEVQAPEVIEFDTGISTAEMVEIGKDIYDGKGTCFTCHANTSRYPDLQGIAEQAGSRIPGYTALDYFAESLYEPDVYLVPGFNSGMPAINKPPIGLTDQEILAVIAYLQTLGGQATVTMDTLLAYTGGQREGEGGGAMATDDGAAAGGGEVAAAAVGGPLTPWGCDTCHDGIEASSLDGFGAGHSADETYLLLQKHPGSDLESLTLGDLARVVEALGATGGGA